MLLMPKPHDALLDRFLRLPAATAPSFAADGRLFFLCDASGSNQVWELPTDGDPARQRTRHRDAVSFVAGSPLDGSAVFGRDNAGDERVQLHHLPPEADEPRALTADPGTIHSWGAFSPDGRHVAFTSNARDRAHADPWVMGLASGSARRVAEMEGPHELPAWHPNGEALVLLSAPRAFSSALLSVSLDGAALSPLTQPDGDRRHNNPRWRRDGAGFWLLTDRNRDFLAAAWAGSPSGEPCVLYAPDADVERLEPSPNERLLAVSVNERGWSRLRLLDAETGAVVAEPDHPPGVITKLSWRPDSAAVAFDLAWPTRPGTLWLAGTEGAPARLLFTAADAPGEARPWEEVSFPSHDGLSIPAFLILPAGAPPPGGWPALVWVHGGPEAQGLPNWRPDLQAICALGAAVLVPNVRGSTGYGRHYAAQDDRAKRPDAVRDLAVAHAYLAARPEVDGARIAVMGQSYGGWMVLMAVTRQPELWAAGVEYYGIARWKTFFERTGPWRVAHRAAEYGDPVRDADLLESLSPLHDVDRIRCPMFVAQGLTDPRVPPHESEQIVAALRARKVPVDSLVFPDEGHGFLKRDNRRTAYLGVMRFLGQHLTGGD